jgi:Mg2+-importing ATPase
VWDDIRNPLILLLVALGVLSYATGDLRATVVIFVMVLLGVVLRFFQELRADNAAARLKAMVGSTATVIRGGIEVERPLRSLVPGDIIALAAGDMVPADVRVLAGKDLFLNQAALTGEAMPVERKAAPAPAAGGTRSTCRTCASWVRTWKAARPRPCPVHGRPHLLRLAGRQRRRRARAFP